MLINCSFPVRTAALCGRREHFRSIAKTVERAGKEALERGQRSADNQQDLQAVDKVWVEIYLLAIYCPLSLNSFLCSRNAIKLMAFHRTHFSGFPIVIISLIGPRNG